MASVVGCASAIAWRGCSLRPAVFRDSGTRFSRSARWSKFSATLRAAHDTFRGHRLRLVGRRQAEVQITGSSRVCGDRRWGCMRVRAACLATGDADHLACCGTDRRHRCCSCRRRRVWLGCTRSTAVTAAAGRGCVRTPEWPTKRDARWRRDPQWSRIADDAAKGLMHPSKSPPSSFWRCQGCSSLASSYKRAPASSSLWQRWAADA